MPEKHVPSDLVYASDGYWVKLEEDIAIVGLTAYALDALGTVAYVELPEAGSELQASDYMGSVESMDGAVELHSPVSGRVVAVNEDLAMRPDRVSLDPYGDGWIMEIKITDPSEIDVLLAFDDYEWLIMAR